MSMDVNIETMWRIKLNKLADKLRANQMDAFIAGSPDELVKTIDHLIPSGSSVCNGGSMTLYETGILDYLRERQDIVYYDRDGAKKAESDTLKDVYRQAFSSDYYLASTNAITEEGWLYNVDSTGNRVAAMLFGPRNVIIICGRNKLVRTLEDAERRVRDTVSPANCMRLGRKTPCTATGVCMDCSSPDRICNLYTVIRKQNEKGRIKVVILNYEAGY